MTDKSDKPTKALPFTADTVGNKVLQSIVERVEDRHKEREEIADDIAAIFAEAKSNGYDLPALRFVIKRRRQREKNPDRYKELETIAEVYEAALAGMRPPP